MIKTGHEIGNKCRILFHIEWLRLKPLQTLQLYFLKRVKIEET